MAAINELVLALLSSLIIVYGAYSLGCLFTRELIRDFSLKHDVMSVALGLFIVSFSINLLSWARLIYADYLWLAFAIIVVASTLLNLGFLMTRINSWQNSLRGIFGFSLAEKAIICILCALFFIYLLSSLAPVFEYDSLSYHLTIPKKVIQTHSNGDYYEFVWVKYQSEFLHSLYVLPLIFDSSGTAANVLICLISFMLCIMIALYCRDYLQSLKKGLLASLIFYLTPMVIEYASTPKSDLFLSFYVFLALYAISDYSMGQKFASLILSAVFCSAMIGVKITSVLLFLPYFVCLLLVIKKRRIVKLAGIALAIFLLSAPFFIKGTLFAGNPIYPYGYSLLGGKPLNPSLIGGLETLSIYGTQKSLKGFLTLPLDIFLQETRFDSFMGLSILFLLFIPLLIIYNKYVKNRAVIILALVSAYFTIAWFVFLPLILRYMFPVIAILSMLTSYSFGVAMKQSRLLRYISVGVLIFCIVFNSALVYGIHKKTVVYTLSAETRDEFFSKLTDLNIYKQMQVLNKLAVPKDKVFVVQEPRTFYLDADYAIGFYMGMPDEQARLLRTTDLKSYLIMNNFTYVLYNKQQNFTRVFGLEWDEMKPRLVDEMRSALINISEDSNGVIYKVQNG